MAASRPARWCAGLYTVRIYIPLTSLSNARVDIMTAFVSFERVFEVLDTPNAIEDADDAVELPTSTRGAIRFQDVVFRYPDPAPGTPASLGGGETTASADDVLRGIDVDIAPVRWWRSSAHPVRQDHHDIARAPPLRHHLGVITIDGLDVRAVTQDSAAPVDRRRQPGSASLPREGQ